MTLSANDILYRLWRLRRLIAVAIVLPLPFLAFAMFLGAAVGTWMIPIWVVMVLAHAVVFPHAWSELIALGLSFSVAFVFAPLWALLGLGWILGYPAAVVLIFFTWMALSTRLFQLEAFSSPVATLRFKARVPLDLEATRAAFFLRPDAVVGHYQCGPADDGGVFEVTPLDMPTVAPMVNESLLEEEDCEVETPEPFSFLAKVTAASDTRQETIIIADFSQDDPEVQSTVQELKPTRRGTIYEKRETGTGMGLFSALGFWLGDVETDYFVDTVDRATGAKPRSIRSASPETPFTMIARRMVARRAGPITDA